MSGIVERLRGGLVHEWTDDHCLVDTRKTAAVMTEAADTITDLLALLNECADFVQPFNNGQDLLDRIEAAIAKAKGETP